MARSNSPKNPARNHTVYIKALDRSVTQRVAWMHFAVLVSSVITLVLPKVAIADTYYVSKTGSRIYPYDSWATAADTVARAVEAASEWDTILIAAGHYVTDTVRMKRGQVLKGAGMASTVLDTLPLNPTWPIIAEDSCIVCDLALIGIALTSRNSYEHSLGSSANLVSNSSIRITDDRGMIIKGVRFQDVTSALAASYTNLSKTGRTCRVDSCEFLNFEKALSGLVSRLDVFNCTFSWSRFANIAAIRADFSELTVEKCTFYGYDPSTSVSGAAAISTYRSDSIVVRNCLFHSHFSDPALELNWQDGLTSPIGLGLVENNTFAGFYHHLLTDRPGFVFRNNLSIGALSGSSTNPFYSGSATGTYNITWNNSPWDSGVVRNGDTIPNDLGGNHDNREIYPMLVDTIDFLLQAFSPAIDAGDPSILDVDGSRSDIGYTGGPGGFSYSYLDLPPAVPEGFRGTPSATEIALSWHRNLASDFAAYELFRDTMPIPSSDSNLLLATLASDTIFTDTAVTSGESYFYRIRAVDAQSNTSDLSGELQFVASVVDENPSPLPVSFVLHPSYPNPFNGSARIRLDVTSTGPLVLSIYNVRGQKVAVLFDGVLKAGTVTFAWRPERLSSGLYLIRASMDSSESIQKALYLK